MSAWVDALRPRSGGLSNGCVSTGMSRGVPNECLRALKPKVDFSSKNAPPSPKSSKLPMLIEREAGIPERPGSDRSPAGRRRGRSYGLGSDSRFAFCLPFPLSSGMYPSKPHDDRSTSISPPSSSSSSSRAPSYVESRPKGLRNASTEALDRRPLITESRPPYTESGPLTLPTSLGSATPR